MQKCLKCGSVAPPNESSLDYPACPDCGAYYAKVEAALARRALDADAPATTRHPLSRLVTVVVVMLVMAVVTATWFQISRRGAPAGHAAMKAAASELPSR